MPVDVSPAVRRFLIRLPRLLRSFAPVAVLSLAAAVVADPERESNDPNTPAVEDVNPADRAFYRFIFLLGGDDPLTTPAQMRKLQERKLLLKIAIVDRVCGLTDSQKEKLRLAGQGDIKQQFDQIEGFGRRFQLVRDQPEKLRALADEVRPLRRAIYRLGLSDGDVLFGRILQTLLTAEQRGRYEPVRTAVSAGGTIQIRQVKSSTSLSIHGGWSRIVDDDLAHFSQVSNLTDLAVEATQVTDAGLEHLAGLTHLQDLDLNETQVTDAGLKHLAALTQLRKLDLRRIGLTDAGLEHLAGLTQLQELILRYAQVTEAGLLEHLAGLTQLQDLDLVHTPVTDSGVEKLKLALPGCTIAYG